MNKNTVPSKNSHSEIPRGWRVVVGQHAIEQALTRSSQWIRKAWFRTGFESSKELKDIHKLCLQKKIVVEVKPESHLHKIYPNHQGMILFLEGRPRITWEDLSEHKNSRLIALDGVEDPHNLGAVLRTSWLAGAHGLLAPENHAVGLSPTVHKVACGGVEHVPFESTTQFLSRLEDLKQQDYWVFGLSHKAKKSIFDVKIPQKVIWVLGAEDKGLRSTTEKVCDELVSLPQIDAAASYNVSVAAAMVLFESMKQSRPN